MVVRLGWGHQQQITCIHPQLGARRVLARIHIALTHLTHSFLLKQDDAPQCQACDCVLTVQHILFDCVDFIKSRNGRFDIDSFEELFEKVPPDSMISYLHEIGVVF